MAEEYVPLIIEAMFTPNPANVGDSVLFQVIVVDALVAEAEAIFMSGEFQSGEV